ncbi:class I SAM-dependent DNA methyltransferase [Vulgatibacter sp.]|uniref:class I SAM-dependent DNA methyltransferase n=1 Tax=Vulgatibacter sp. TaxID=1971226 RepID=UPI003567ECFC
MEDRRWRGWDNAEIYDRFVRERRIYSWLNERLVERAALGDARRVLDLGCGTGATTQACLALLPADAEVVGVDQSLEMVEVARAQTLDPRASFVVAEAGAAAAALEGTFDRAVSNAAFWQFPDRPKVLAGLSSVLAPGARFVFNVPAERVESAPFHPFQVALARAIESRTGAAFVRTSTPFDPERFAAEVRPFGLELLAQERLEYEGPQGELVELMEIPAMIAPLTEELDEAATREVLAEAAAATDPKERVRVAWLYLTLQRN